MPILRYGQFFSNEEGQMLKRPASWEESLELEGSKYVGLVGQILKELPMTDIEKRWDLSDEKPLLAKEGELYVSYLNKGGKITIEALPKDLSYRWVDPKTGDTKQMGKATSTTFTSPDENPWVLIVSN